MGYWMVILSPWFSRPGHRSSSRELGGVYQPPLYGRGQKKGWQGPEITGDHGDIVCWQHMATLLLNQVDSTFFFCGHTFEIPIGYWSLKFPDLILTWKPRPEKIRFFWVLEDETRKNQSVLLAGTDPHSSSICFNSSWVFFLIFQFTKFQHPYTGVISFMAGLHQIAEGIPWRSNPVGNPGL